MYDIKDELVEDAKGYIDSSSYEKYQQEAEKTAERYDDYFAKKVNEIVTSPLFNMLGDFSIYSIGDMARTLVSLTSFKGKYSGNIRNVSGPIDVLVVSRGDGPVWLSNKKLHKNNITTDTFYKIEIA